MPTFSKRKPSDLQETKKETTTKVSNKESVVTVSDDVKEFMSDMFKSINRELGENALHDLSINDDVVVVKRFVSTGSKQLDYCISNNFSGGFPEGRITEISGPNSCGKSTMALVAAANVQKMGGVVIYIDSEQALNLKRAQGLGVNVKERFYYSRETCTEKIFDLVEKTVLKLKTLEKDIPTLVVWDSVAASTPKGELESTYEQNTIGLQARALRKGLRKINEVLAGEKVAFVVVNHITLKIGVMFGNPETTTGGTAFGFWSSLRLKFLDSKPIKKSGPNGEEIVGVTATVKVTKNRMERAHREISFDILYDKGIHEAEHMFDVIREYCDRVKGNPIVVGDKKIAISGVGAWKEFNVIDTKTENSILTEKFHKADFKEKILDNPNYKEYVQALLDAAYIVSSGDVNHVTQGKPEEEDEEVATLSS